MPHALDKIGMQEQVFVCDVRDRGLFNRCVMLLKKNVKRRAAGRLTKSDIEFLGHSPRLLYDFGHIRIARGTEHHDIWHDGEIRN